MRAPIATAAVGAGAPAPGLPVTRLAMSLVALATLSVILLSSALARLRTAGSVSEARRSLMLEALERAELVMRAISESRLPVRVARKLETSPATSVPADRPSE